MRLPLIAAALAIACCAGSASAAVFTFTVTSVVQSTSDPSYVPNYAFKIDDAADVFEDNGFFFKVRGIVTHGTRPIFGSPDGDVEYTVNYNFYTSAPSGFGGGFDDEGQNSYFSEQLFTGTTAMPTFRTGTFSLFINDPLGRPDATLTIAGVPEPSSWALMILGFGLAGVALRRRGRGAEGAHLGGRLAL